MENLGKLIGRGKQLIYKLEHGMARYNETTQRSIAEALNISQHELLSADENLPSTATFTRSSPIVAPNLTGFSEAGAEPFEYDAAKHPPLLPLTPTQSRYRVLSRDLSEKGLVPGQVITVEPHSDWRNGLEDGEALLVRINDELQLRQFLGPDLLVTNSSGVMSALRISGHNVALIGKIVGNIGW